MPDISLPSTFSAFDLLDAYVTLALFDPGHMNRMPLTDRARDNAAPEIRWHYQALGALARLYETPFDIFGPVPIWEVLEQYQQQRQPSDGWDEIAKDMKALGIDSPAAGVSRETIAPLITLFEFLVKWEDLRGYQEENEETDDHPLTGRLVGQLLASTDPATLLEIQQLLVSVLDPAERTFTAEQVVAAGYPTWEIAYDEEG